MTKYLLDVPQDTKYGRSLLDFTQYMRAALNTKYAEYVCTTGGRLTGCSGVLLIAELDENPNDDPLEFFLRTGFKVRDPRTVLSAMKETPHFMTSSRFLEHFSAQQ